MSNLHSVYEHDDYFLIRKPRGIASTWGKESSLLDTVQNSSSHPGVDDDLDTLLGDRIYEFLNRGNWSPASWESAYKHLIQTFSSQEEFGLLNRLDTPTGGFLTFARSPQAKLRYLQLQSEGVINKHYLALVSGNPQYLIDNPSLSSGAKRSISDNQITISAPLMHHRHLDDRMITIRSKNDLTKGRGKQLECSTSIIPLEYDPHADQTLIQCIITAGQRHQIRVHCQILGYPIVGDELYGREKVGGLELWCLGYIMQY